MTRLIVWGAGELGGRVARLWREQDRPVIGLTKSEDRHDALRANGIEPRTGSAVDLLLPEDRLLLSVAGHQNQLALVEALAETPPPARVVLISTTGIYGRTPRGTVSEATPPDDSDRAQSIAQTEQVFQAWARDRGVIVRLGGLYRPGRGPLPPLKRRGHPREGPPNKAMALIHYDDAAAATFAALEHPTPEAIYLAVTPPCPTRAEFYTLACEQLGLPAPAFTAPLPHPPAEYDVSRLRRDLLPVPSFPDWQAALEE